MNKLEKMLFSLLGFTCFIISIYGVKLSLDVEKIDERLKAIESQEPKATNQIIYRIDRETIRRIQKLERELESHKSKWHGHIEGL